MDNYKFTEYFEKEVIDKAVKLKFDVISFTFHDYLFYPKEIKEYAEVRVFLIRAILLAAFLGLITFALRRLGII